MQTLGPSEWNPLWSSILLQRQETLSFYLNQKVHSPCLIFYRRHRMCVYQICIKNKYKPPKRPAHIKWRYKVIQADSENFYAPIEQQVWVWVFFTNLIKVLILCSWWRWKAQGSPLCIGHIATRYLPNCLPSSHRKQPCSYPSLAFTSLSLVFGSL